MSSKLHCVDNHLAERVGILAFTLKSLFKLTADRPSHKGSVKYSSTCKFNKIRTIFRLKLCKSSFHTRQSVRHKTICTSSTVKTAKRDFVTYWIFPSAKICEKFWNECG